MSHENTKNPLVGAKPGCLDNETTLIIIDGKCAIQILMPNEETALKKKEGIERDKFCYEEDFMFSPTYLLSSNYSISTQGNNVVIQGPLKELDAAIQRLYTYGRHISEQRKTELIKEIDKIHVKEVLAREHQARQEKRKALQDAKEREKETRVHKKYTRLATKLGMDPNTIFPSSPKAITEKNSSPTLTGTAIALTSKNNKAK